MYINIGTKNMAVLTMKSHLIILAVYIPCVSLGGTCLLLYMYSMHECTVTLWLR